MRRRLCEAQIKRKDAEKSENTSLRPRGSRGHSERVATAIVHGLIENTVPSSQMPPCQVVP